MLNKSISTETITLKPPDWLSGPARKVWKRKLKQLVNAGLLNHVDLKPLATFCDSVGKYAHLSGEREISIADHKTLQRYSRTVLRCAEKLGFTPSARASFLQKRARKKHSKNGASEDETDNTT